MVREVSPPKVSSRSPSHSPGRRPLHERSRSQTNLPGTAQLAAAGQSHLDFLDISFDPPTKRDVIYSRSPFPSEPAHVLTPGRRREGISNSPWQGSAVVISPITVSEDAGPTSSLPATPSRPTFYSQASLSPASPSVDKASRTPSPGSPRPVFVPKRAKQVTVHPDKTFSVLDVLRPDGPTDRVALRNRSLPSLTTTPVHSEPPSALVAPVPRAGPSNALALNLEEQLSDDNALSKDTQLRSVRTSPDLKLQPPTTDVPSQEVQPCQKPSAQTRQDLSERASWVSFASTAATERTVTGLSSNYADSSLSRSTSTLVLVPSREPNYKQSEHDDPSAPEPQEQASKDSRQSVYEPSAESTVFYQQPLHTPPKYPEGQLAADADAAVPLRVSQREESDASLHESSIPSSPPEPLSPAENYEILGRTSPLQPSSPEPNFVVLGRTSPVAAPSSPQPNYVVHSRTSPVLEASSPSHANYIVLGRTSPIAEPSSPGEPNYTILGRTSPVAPSSPGDPNYVVLGRTSPVAEPSSPSEPNYVVLGRTSPVAPASPPAAPQWDISAASLPEFPSGSSLAHSASDASLPPLRSEHSLELASSSGRASHSLHRTSLSSLRTVPTLGSLQAQSIPELAPASSEYHFRDFDGSSPSALSEIDEEGDQTLTLQRRTSLAGPSHAIGYSQESLIVPPLRPRARLSTERFGYVKTRSRETLRTASFTSISTALTQEAVRGIITQASITSLRAAAAAISWAESGDALSQLPMHANPHQWSAQLSTVQSESEPSDRGSRGWSRSARMSSSHSRQLLSVSSSLLQELEERSPDYPERPNAAYLRRDLTGSSMRISAQDEHGDGLADLHALRNRPSRNRLYNSIISSSSSDIGRSNSIISSSSSRNNSFLTSSFPTWARLYYGSGERRPLTSASLTSGSSRPQSFVGAYNGQYNTSNIYVGEFHLPRPRPHGSDHPAAHIVDEVDEGQVETGNPQPRRFSFKRLSTRRLRTPSIWSPHLAFDRQANRMSIWEAPSLTWSTEGRWTGRRNVQVVMFILGFVLPLAWMIASFLPLPHFPKPPMEQRPNDVDVETTMEEYVQRQVYAVEESRYDSAKWWRTLNRIMSVLGLGIIAAIVVLAVLGAQSSL